MMFFRQTWRSGWKIFKRASQNVLHVLPVAEVCCVLNLLRLKKRWLLDNGIKSNYIIWYLVGYLFMYLKFSQWL